MVDKKESKPADRFGYPRPAPKPSQTKKKRGPKGKEASEN